MGLAADKKHSRQCEKNRNLRGRAKSEARNLATRARGRARDPGKLIILFFMALVVER